MDNDNLSVREMTEKDIPLFANYWFTASDDFLKGMGVDLQKMPTREQFTQMLQTQLSLPYAEKKAYALIWEAEGEPFGHSNVNPVTYGKEGAMHLHIWKPEMRALGIGAEMVGLSLPYYFGNMKLERVYSEPYAHNTAPHKTLEKAGFTFVKEYVTTPGSITFEQPVKQWEIFPK
ncbi:GNAT family N-acetyltransferase [Flavobacterium sp. MFBS3-15]|uniref:GNAT family N-acetyltransferase n=1 Tax=Flavobacterium sp. MFBS3-15 TaxID=2989816 RepID=UPI002235C71A|nr:GNAT family protein [Flavobacterium sp. MFBS3-15]MCW4470730.1 GNAT family N-acetyltransferase [Flavobacterium sp. MFBS3-15]